MALNDPVPTFEPDFWSDEVILEPYPHYDRLRALGPVVWLARHEAWALTRYDVVRSERRPSDHLGFGMGTHLCAGMHLAKLEIAIILEVMTRKVRRIHAAEPVRRPHNTLRGLMSLRCSFERL